MATTIGGLMNSQMLASLLGLTAIPVGEPGGTNYAAGGAANVAYATYSNARPQHGQPGGRVSDRRQRSRQSERALFDQLRRQRYYQAPSVSGGVCPAMRRSWRGLGRRPDRRVAQLHTAGARYFVVPITYGAAPHGQQDLGGGDDCAHLRSGLYAELAAAGVNFVPVSGKVIADAIGFNSATVRHYQCHCRDRRSRTRAAPASIQIPATAPAERSPPPGRRTARRSSRPMRDKRFSTRTTSITVPPGN